jgi:hypothetical protein
MCSNRVGFIPDISGFLFIYLHSAQKLVILLKYNAESKFKLNTSNVKN